MTNIHFLFINRCRWFKRPSSPKNHLLSTSSLQILHQSLHLIWMLSSSLPSLLPAMVASFLLSSCRKNRGTTSLTFCGHSTAFSTTSPNWSSSTQRWRDKLCFCYIIVTLCLSGDAKLYLYLVPQHVDSDPSQRSPDQTEERGRESKRGYGPGNPLKLWLFLRESI